MPRTTTMTAAVTVQHGGPEVVELHTDWPVPEVRAGDVLVRVTAAAVNNTDIWTREGSYGTSRDPDAVAGWKGVPIEFPRIQGIDVAGVVEEVGTRSIRRGGAVVCSSIRRSPTRATSRST